MALIKKFNSYPWKKIPKFSLGITNSCTSNVEKEKKTSEINLKFDDPKIAFKSKTTLEILRSYIVYQLLCIKPVVERNLILMKYSNKILGDKLFILLMKSTFFGHFVAGEDEKSIVPLIKRMKSFGVGSILDYSVEEDVSQEEAESLEKQALENVKTELPQYQVNNNHLDRRKDVTSARTFFYVNEEICDKNMERFLKCIDSVSEVTADDGIIAIKLTALCKPNLLLQISEVIAKCRIYLNEILKDKNGLLPVIKRGITMEEFEKKIYDIVKDKKEGDRFLKLVTADKEGIIHLFPWSGILNDEFEANETFKVPNLENGEMIRFMSYLTKSEEKHFKNMIKRLNVIMKFAKEKNVKVMVDAEQTYFQPAISRLTVELMRKYNTQDGIVYNTYQNYLKSCYDEIMSDLEQAKRQNFYFRCKLVRGAYMNQERVRAKEMNYEDPIQPTYEATSENFSKVMIECFKKINKLKENGVVEKKIAIMVASHNEDTIRLAVEKMKEMGINPGDRTVMFGQLLGMCDFVSFTLGDAGYPIYKYTPYGPVKEVLPYLSRRALENRGIFKNVKKEKALLRKEIFNRLIKLDLNRDPKGPIAS